MSTNSLSASAEVLTRSVDLGENTITAAAQILSAPGLHPIVPPATDRSWQSEIWNLSKEIPELGFYITWHHAAASRVRLSVARVKAGQNEPELITTGPIAEAMSAFAGGPAPASALLARSTAHIAAVGETYTVFVSTESESGDPTWAAHAFSDREISHSPALGWQVNTGDGTGPHPLPAGAHVVRAWEPDLAYSSLPYSAVVPALPVLRELRSLTMVVGAEADSRLSAGIMFWPQSVAFPGGIKSFVSSLVDQLSAPIKDRSSAASVVPLPVAVPDEAIEKIKHMRFGMDLSIETKELRDESIRRFAMAARIPPEVVTGMGDVTHWGQWFIDEQGIRLFIAPEVHVVAHAWTIGWLRPFLLAADLVKEDEVEDYLIWPDFTPLTLRPDRSSDAVSLFDRYILSEEALRRETGFDASDAPDEEQVVRQVLFAVLRAAPSAAAQILPLLGYELDLPGNPIQREGAPESTGEVPFEPAPGEPQQVATNQSSKAPTPAVSPNPPSDKGGKGAPS